MTGSSLDDRAQGWATFAAVLFLIVGIFNVIDGTAALSKDDHFRADELLFGDLSMWGVIFLVVGVLQLLTTFLIYRRSAMGQVLGVTLASLNAVAALLSLGAYPVWTIIILVVDGVVIYALTVYGESLPAR